MDCERAAPFISAVYDGENAPSEAVQHISSCPHCRLRLQDYAQMTGELRLLASLQTKDDKQEMEIPVERRKRKRWAPLIMGKVSVPRFAVALSILAILGLAAGLKLIRAQSEGLWFLYEAQENDSPGVRFRRFVGQSAGRTGFGPL